MAWDIFELLRETVNRNASDLHLTVGIPPTLRIHGYLIPLEGPSLKPQDTELFARTLAGEKRWTEFLQNLELDFSVGIPDLGRFRVNIYRQRGSCGLAIRALSYRIPRWTSCTFPRTPWSALLLFPGGLCL
jgi:twitching motility protein PilT